MIQTTSLKFLKNLAKNNNKLWFDSHRAQYETARKDFGDFIQAVIDAFGKADPDIASLEAKQCMFRINRDVRFSKNKAPYKKNFAASIKRGGRKSVFAGYYFHLEPGNSFMGGGIWMPMPDETKKIRQEIDYCQDEFNKILSSRTFKTLYGGLERLDGVSLVNVPKGYEKDHPAAPYLKLKSWFADRAIPDADLHSKTLLKQTVKAFNAIQPLVYFLNRAVEE